MKLDLDNLKNLWTKTTDYFLIYSCNMPQRLVVAAFLAPSWARASLSAMERSALRSLWTRKSTITARRLLPTWSFPTTLANRSATSAAWLSSTSKSRWSTPSSAATSPPWRAARAAQSPLEPACRRPSTLCHWPAATRTSAVSSPFNQLVLHLRHTFLCI